MLTVFALATALAAHGVVPPPQGPVSVVREAVAAVEGDSAGAARARWTRTLENDPGNRLATLGLATLAALSFEDSVAERLYHVLLDSTTGPPDAVRGYAAVGLARLAGKVGDWRRADALAEEGVAAGRALGDATLTGEALVTLAATSTRTRGAAAAHAHLDEAEGMLPGTAYRVRGLARCARAQALWFAGDTLALVAALEGATLADSAQDLRTRAICLLVAAGELARQARLDSALAVYGRLIPAYRKMRDRAGLAVALQWRAHLHGSIGWLPKARRDAEEAIVEAEASGTHAVLPWARRTLAEVALALGDVAGGQADAEEAARLFAAHGDRYAAIAVRSLAGQLAMLAGDRDAARATYREALAEAEAVGWAESRVSLHRALMHVALLDGDSVAARRELEATERVARAHAMAGWENDYYRGLVALRSGRLGEAERWFRAGQAGALEVQPSWRYLNSARLAEVLARGGRIVDAGRELVAASQALDQWRRNLRYRDLRLLALQLAEDQSDPDLGVATVIAALAANGAIDSAFEIVERQRARSLADRLNRAAALDTAATDDTAAADGRARRSPTLSLREVRSAMLDDSTVVLEFVTGRGGEPTTLFVITWRETWAFVLPPVDSLAASVARMTVLLESGEDARAVSRALGTALLDSALASLPRSARRLVVVPDGVLQQIPFDALVMADGRYVLEAYTVAEAPSATIAARLWAPRLPPPRAALIVADPRFGAETSVPADAEVFRSAVAGEGGLPRLRGSSREARAVARYATDATVRRRADASEAWLKGAALAEYGVVHFATHALVDGSSIENTALALAPGDGEDGFVGAGELAGLKLAAELVVLSACRTAGGVVVRGEGVQGLAAPLLAAGARAVAATWWPVGDAATVRLVDDFYGAMAAGLPVADALRDAKLAALTRGAPAREWAAFTVVGDPLARPRLEPAPPAPSPTLRYALAVGLGLLAAYGLAIWQRRRQARG